MKTNLFLTALFSMLLHTLCAQYYSFKKPKGSIGFVIGSEFGARSLEYVDNSTSVINAPLQNQELIQARSKSIRVGVNYSKFLAPDTYLRTGLRFSSPGYKSGFLTTVDTKLSDEYVAERDGVPFQDRYNFEIREYKIEIPMLLRYHFMTDKCAIFAEGGMSAEFNLASTVRKDIEKAKSEPVIVDSNLVNLYAVIAVGSEWEVTDSFPMFLQMVMRYTPIPYQLGQTQAREFTVGVELGTRKYF